MGTIVTCSCRAFGKLGKSLIPNLFMLLVTLRKTSCPTVQYKPMSKNNNTDKLWAG